MRKEACITQTDIGLPTTACRRVVYRGSIITSPLVTFTILCNQLSRAVNISHMIRQRIGDGCGEARNTIVGFQLELVVDIGLAVCAFARRNLNIIGFVVTSRFSILRRLIGRHFDQLHVGRLVGNIVLILGRAAIGFVLEADGLSRAQPAERAPRAVLGNDNRIDPCAGITILLEHQLEGTNV